MFWYAILYTIRAVKAVWAGLVSIIRFLSHVGPTTEHYVRAIVQHMTWSHDTLQAAQVAVAVGAVSVAVVALWIWRGTAQADSSPSRAEAKTPVTNGTPSSSHAKKRSQKHRGPRMPTFGTSSKSKHKQALPSHPAVIAQARGHSNLVVCAAASSTGLLAAGDVDGMVRVSTEQGALHSTLDVGHALAGIAWSPEGSWLAATTQAMGGHAGGMLKLYRVKSGGSAFELDSEWPSKLRLPADLVAMGACGGMPFVLLGTSRIQETNVCMLCVSTGRWVHRFSSGLLQTHSLHVSASGSWFSVVGHSNEAQLYHVQNKGALKMQLACTLRHPDRACSQLRAVLFNPADTKAMQVGADGSVVVWDIAVNWRANADPRVLDRWRLPVQEVAACVPHAPGAAICAVLGQGSSEAGMNVCAQSMKTRSSAGAGERVPLQQLAGPVQQCGWVGEHFWSLHANSQRVLIWKLL